MTKEAVIRHTTVMLPEVLSGLKVVPGGRYIDATCGEGGHTKGILEATQGCVEVLCIDADREALEVAKQRLSSYQNSLRFDCDNFRNLKQIASKQRFGPVHGVLFDCGVSSLQLDSDQKGFSFSSDYPLDMRFHPEQSLSAAEIVNFFSKKEIASIIFRYGEDRYANRIAQAIVNKRPIKTSRELGVVVSDAYPKSYPYQKIHPATRTFQALRIAVNDELVSLESALSSAVSLLGYEGRLVTITYHSLEDRIVKRFIKEQSSTCSCLPESPICHCEKTPSLRPLARKPLTPTKAEVSSNRRSRSAKLRVAERI